jgi:transcriptional regulator with XRE-family HTH domain
MMINLRARFQKFRNKDYREEFVSARIATAIGAQIAALRQKRGWSQQQLAEYAHMKQPRIALLETGDYESFSFSTLKRLAAAFEVAIRIDFLNFPDFLRWSESFDSESILAPESFATSLARMNEDRPSTSVKDEEAAEPLIDWRRPVQTVVMPEEQYLPGGTIASVA